MWAAYHNDLAMVRLLLDRGADPNRSTYFGTPLSHACWNDGFEAAAELIDHGANVNARDAVAGFTPLHWAAGDESLRPHLVKLLLGSGADPNAVGGESVGALGLVPQTPRLIAEKRGRTAIVDALVAAGAKDPPLTREDRHAATCPAGRARSIRRSSPRPRRRWRRCKRPRPDRASRSSGTSAGKTASRATNSTCRWPPWAMPATGPSASIGRPPGNRSTWSSTPGVRSPIASSSPRPSFIREPAHSFGYELLGFVAERVPPSAMTDGQVHHLVTIQASDGRWNQQYTAAPDGLGRCQCHGVGDSCDQDTTAGGAARRSSRPASIAPAGGCGRSRRKRMRKRSSNCSACTGRASRPRC